MPLWPHVAGALTGPVQLEKCTITLFTIINGHPIVFTSAGAYTSFRRGGLGGRRGSGEKRAANGARSRRGDLPLSEVSTNELSTSEARMHGATRHDMARQASSLQLKKRLEAAERENVELKRSLYELSMRLSAALARPSRIAGAVQPSAPQPDVDAGAAIAVEESQAIAAAIASQDQHGGVSPSARGAHRGGEGGGGSGRFEPHLDLKGHAGAVSAGFKWRQFSLLTNYYTHPSTVSQLVLSGA